MNKTLENAGTTLSVGKSVWVVGNAEQPHRKGQAVSSAGGVAHRGLHDFGEQLRHVQRPAVLPQLYTTHLTLIPTRTSPYHRLLLLGFAPSAASEELAWSWMLRLRALSLDSWLVVALTEQVSIRVRVNEG